MDFGPTDKGTSVRWPCPIVRKLQTKETLKCEDHKETSCINSRRPICILSSPPACLTFWWESCRLNQTEFMYVRRSLIRWRKWIDHRKREVVQNDSKMLSRTVLTVIAIIYKSIHKWIRVNSLFLPGPTFNLNLETQRTVNCFVNPPNSTLLTVILLLFLIKCRYFANLFKWFQIYCQLIVDGTWEMLR